MRLVVNLAPSPACSTSESPSTALLIERLRIDDLPVDLALSPRLTVVAGLGPAGRARVIEAVAGVLGGRCDGVSGTVLVEGVRFEIEDDLAGLLELPAGAGHSVVSGEDVEAAVAAATGHLVRGTGGATAARRDSLRAQMDQLRAALDELSDADTDPSEDDFLLEAMAEDLAVRRQAAVAMIEEARAQAQARVLMAPEPVAPPAPPPEQAAAPGSEALALADRAADLRARSAGVPLSTVPEWLRTQTLEQLEEARADVARLEAEQGGRRINAEDAAALEAAHAAVDEAEDKATKRFASVLSKRRLEAARATELELLEQLGIPSYATFVLQQATGAIVDPRLSHRLAAARAALADAEAVAAAVEARAGDPAAAALKAEETALRHEAAAVLGRDAALAVADIGLERLETLLRNHGGGTPAAPAEAEAELEAVEAIAARDEVAEVDDAVAAAEAELAVLEHEEALLHAELDRLRQPVPAHRREDLVVELEQVTDQWERAACDALAEEAAAEAGAGAAVVAVAQLLTQRLVAQQGVPLVIDDAFAAMPGDVVQRVLAHLSGLAAAAQIVYLADGTEIAEGARSVVGDEGVIAVL